MIRFEDIYETVRRHHPGADLELLRKAYIFSAVEHKGQTRASGEPYLVHPSRWRPSWPRCGWTRPAWRWACCTTCSRTPSPTPERIKEYFGADVLHIVEGVTKISKIPFSTSEERQAENFRKMLLAMVDDIRVILVKLADRLHNMRTLQYLPEERRERIARETMDIYAPLAGRLGMSKIKNELEDLSFQYLEPEAYQRADRARRGAAQAGHRRSSRRSRARWPRSCRRPASRRTLEGRIKRLYSIHQKLRRQRIDLDQVYDFVALRIVVPTIPDCYAALGVLHNLWRPVPGRIKDFIAMPRPNGYQSLHTSVIGDEGQPFEVQIRTREMHRIAEEGIAAHWKYKEGRSGFDKDDQAFAWLRQLLEWQQEVKDPHEFLNSLKLDLYPEEVYCFTPKGEVKTLPRGATPDRLRLRHPHRGRPPVRGRARQRQDRAAALQAEERRHRRDPDLAPATTRAATGWPSPSPTRRARKIRHYLNTAEKQQALEIGKKHFERELKRYDLTLKKLRRRPQAGGAGPGAGRRHARLEDLFAAVGYGKVSHAPGAGAPAAGGEARGAAAARAAAPARRRRQAPAARGRGAHQGQGHRRPAHLPRQVLQPDHGRADRRLHHPRQGRLRALAELPERGEPDVRPRAAHRRGVGARRRTAAYEVRIAVEVEDRPGPAGRHHRACWPA